MKSTDLFSNQWKAILHFFLLFLLFGAACSQKNKPKSDKLMPVSDYSALWKQVDSLELQAQLPKSALELTEQIYAKAKTENDRENYLRAVIYKAKYKVSLEENGLKGAIALMESELPAAKAPELQILHSMIAQLYHTFYQNELHQIRGRTEVAADTSTDLDTWSMAQFERRIFQHYEASLTLPADLKKLPVAQFGALIVPGSHDTLNQKLIWPGIGDILERRALQYFSESRSYLTIDEKTAFHMTDQAALAPADIFSKYSFATQDTNNLLYQALTIYQSALQGHAQDPDPLSYIFTDLDRIRFVRGQIELNQEEKIENSLLLLEKLSKTYQNHAAMPMIAHEVAQIYMERAGLYDPNNPSTTAYKGDLKNAATYLKKGLQGDPNSEGYKLCTSALRGLEEATIRLTAEMPYRANMPGLLACNYRNINQIHLRLFKWNEVMGKIHNELQDDQARWEYLLKQPAIHNWKYDLQNLGDYREHNTEIQLPPTAHGSYRIIACTDPEFKNRQTGHAIDLTISDLQLVTISKPGLKTFIGLDRKTGAPIPGAEIKVYAVLYEYQPEYRYVKTLVQSGKTDANGMFEMAASPNTALIPELTYNGETIAGNMVYSYPQGQPSENNQMLFFTDRAIYRPGQTLYFKGLAIKYKTDDSKVIMPNQAVTVILRNANYQEVSKLRLTTNAFGTINGTFALPTSGLTGQMTIEVSGESGITGAHGIQVEEYKRPRFEVTIKAPAQVVALGETVEVQGIALNYAGNPTDGAKVKYKIIRKTFFPYCGWYKYWMPSLPDAIVGEGETVTDPEGRFSAKFAAEPPSKTDKKLQPVFHFELTADVTDISGETRTGMGTVIVGFNTIDLGTSLAEKTDISKIKEVEIRTTDLNGNKLGANGTVTIQRFAKTNRELRARPWAAPDVWTLSKETYLKDHPEMPFMDETDPRTWPTAGQAITKPFKTDTGSVKLDLSQEMVAGEMYRVTINTADAQGRPTELITLVKVIDEKSPAKTLSVDSTPFLDKTELQPGQKATLWLDHNQAGHHYFVLIERKSGAEPLKYVQTKGNATPFEIPVTTQDFGGVIVHVATSRHGILQTQNFTINVPDLSKDLKITYETFRDKLSPGAKETWRLRISGKDKDAIAAEVLASMYDASLDQFLPHDWFMPNLWPSLYSSVRWDQIQSQTTGFDYKTYENYASGQYPSAPDLRWFDFPMHGSRYPMYMQKMQRMHTEDLAVSSAPAPEIDNAVLSASSEIVEKKAGSEQAKPKAEPSVRTNLKETVFFFPNLMTDAKGDVIVQFTMNEALTRWKFMTFAHTKDLKMAISERPVITQKELMVLPNAPRFLRAGDRMGFSGKVSNLTSKPMQGTATLELFDAITMQPLQSMLGLKDNSVAFTIPAGQSAPVSFAISLPEIPPTATILWRMRAESGQWADGEENVVPVVTNRMMVTETMPLSVRGGQKKEFHFASLQNANSSTLVHHKYTVEFTSNPAWYAVRALPYLMEYPHECSEQIFSRMYANALASTVANRYPAIRRVYDRWKANGSLQSNLTKNQELKTALLEETPWVLEAQSEEQQQQQIALLFDLNRMADEQKKTIATLAERQNGEGAWPWFSGGRSDEFITRYIMIGMRRLQKLEALSDDQLQIMDQKAMSYLNRQIITRYNKYLSDTAKDPKVRETYSPDATDLYHLYLQSFAPNKMDPATKAAHTFYLTQLGKTWQQRSLYEQGLATLVFHRFGMQAQAHGLIKSLKERAIMSDELGMYWPYDRGYYWYQMPIETQALMVEVMQEVANEPATADELRIWLLKNKQTTHWKTTKETAEAVYAFLIGGNNWLESSKPVAVQVNQKTVKPDQVEEGTGYFKEAWQAKEVQKSLGTVQVNNPNPTIAWGAAYWQYFEDLDKIKDFNTKGLQIKKEVYKVQGEKLTALTDGNRLAPGDKLKVRIIITSDRAYEYVHLKDMRAAGFEPTNVLSGYRWQDGLGYYESTRDLASHFFIDYLPKGAYVFEYPLVVNHKGNFSNGITTMQCMYAPEFSAHSKGIRLSVE